MFEKISCYCYSKKNFLFLVFPIVAVLFFTACGSISNPDNGMTESVAAPAPMGETSVSGYIQSKITVNSSEQVAVVHHHDGGCSRYCRNGICCAHGSKRCCQLPTAKQFRCQ